MTTFQETVDKALATYFRVTERKPGKYGHFIKGKDGREKAAHRRLIVESFANAVIVGLKQCELDEAMTRLNEYAIERLIDSAFLKVGPMRLRSKPAKSATDAQRVFLHRIDWHYGRGSANLHGVMNDSLLLGREKFDDVDSIALLFVLAMRGGRRASASDPSHSARWARALGGK